MPSATDNGFPSPRHDAFPAGLRVLVVDDDLTWLKILEKMLKKCSYEVTTCGLARDALHLLRDRKDGYDIVISDVNMPDMDGFKLLEHVGLEMDLPVIMMSVDGETSRVMKGVQHGACDYLLKPIRMKELRNIWQHVFRKKIHDLRDIEGIEVYDSIHMTRSGSERSDDGFFFCGEDITSGKKRKDWEGSFDKDFADPSSSIKKARVVWSVDLHQKFVKAVNQIGFDKVGPKKILDLMNVPWLTRENVASHLQKYRLYLTRLQKGTDLKTCSTGLKDMSPQDPQSSFCNSNSINGSFASVPNNLFFPNMNRGHEDDQQKGIFQIPKEEPKRVFVPEAPDQLGSTGFGFKAPFQQLASSQVRYTKVDPTVSMHYAWSGVQEKDGNTRVEDLKHLPLPQARAVDPRPCRTEGERTTSTESEKDYRSKNITQETPDRTRTDDFENYQDVVSNPAKRQGMENASGFNPTCLSVSGSVFGSLNEDTQSVGWVQDNTNPINLGLGFSEFNDPEFPINLFDAFRYDYEQQFAEPTECSILGQGLFMA